MPKKGKPRHTFTAMTDAMAVPGSLSQPTPWGRMRKTRTSR